MSVENLKWVKFRDPVWLKGDRSTSAIKVDRPEIQGLWREGGRIYWQVGNCIRSAPESNESCAEVDTLKNAPKKSGSKK